MIETVELHFEGASLPVLTRWCMHWRPQGGHRDVITAVLRGSAGHGPCFHWNLPLMSLCLGLLRLEARCQEPGEALFYGQRGSAASVLADLCAAANSAGRLQPVLAHPGREDARHVHERLNRWFRVTQGPSQRSRSTVIWPGRFPPDHVRVSVDGDWLAPEDFSSLESRLVWMSEERDWLGSVIGRAPAASVA